MGWLWDAQHLLLPQRCGAWVFAQQHSMNDQDKYPLVSSGTNKVWLEEQETR